MKSEGLPLVAIFLGNALTRECLSVQRGRGTRVTITHDALDLIEQGPIWP